MEKIRNLFPDQVSADAVKCTIVKKMSLCSVLASCAGALDSGPRCSRSHFIWLDLFWNKFNKYTLHKAGLSYR